MTKKKVVVVGNCQARPIATLLEKMSDNVEVSNIAIVHLLKPEQECEHKTFFKNADYIITQSIADNYPCEFIRTSLLKDQYGEKVITIINLFYLGYTPDWLYIRIPGKGTLKGPMGDYHNQTIVESWLAGKSVDEASSLVLNKAYNKDKYSAFSKSSLVELRKREVNVDVRLSDYIDENMLSKRLFFTFNHPCISLLVEYVSRMLLFLNLCINDDKSFIPKEALNQLIPVLDVGLEFEFKHEQLYKGLEIISLDASEVVIGKSQQYDLKELVMLFYKVYDFNSRIVKTRFSAIVI